MLTYFSFLFIQCMHCVFLSLIRYDHLETSAIILQDIFVRFLLTSILSEYVTLHCSRVKSTKNRVPLKHHIRLVWTPIRPLISMTLCIVNNINPMICSLQIFAPSDPPVTDNMNRIKKRPASTKLPLANIIYFDKKPGLEPFPLRRLSRKVGSVLSFYLVSPSLPLSFSHSLSPSAIPSFVFLSLSFFLSFFLSLSLSFSPSSMLSFRRIPPSPIRRME